MITGWLIFALSGFAMAATVPMLDIGGRPMANLMLNGKGPYQFIVDTGAESTLIDSGLAAELGLGSGNTIREARLGRAVLKGLNVAPVPMSQMFPQADAPKGVLSAASFPGYLLILNYPQKRITIRKGALPAADNRTIFEYAADEKLPMVPIRIAGHDTAVDLDSGSPLGLTLPVKFLKQLPLASEPKEVGRARTQAGEYPISSAQVAGDIELGQYRLDSSQVRFSDVAPGPEPPHGNIGAQVLRDFKVTFDAKNRRIKLNK